MTLPTRFADVDQLEDAMSTPSPALVEALRRAPGDLLVLGVGGKMGPTLARMAKRADPSRRVIGVARFSEPGLRESLQAHGVECIAADLLSRDALAGLPDAPNVVFMAGRKFGSTGSEWLTWAMNAHVPALVAERLRSRASSRSPPPACTPSSTRPAPARPSRCRPPRRPASTPTRAWRASACSSTSRTSTAHAGRLIRLSYAIDMRYGVLHDVARKVLAHANPSTWPWAMPTSSGRARPTTGRCARWRIATRPPAP
jgi:hypothetical protein